MSTSSSQWGQGQEHSEGARQHVNKRQPGAFFSATVQGNGVRVGAARGGGRLNRERLDSQGPDSSEHEKTPVNHGSSQVVPNNSGCNAGATEDRRS